MNFPLQCSEARKLLDYSARLGRDPLMVQGSTGNTSIKPGDTLWIKGSGCRLADAETEPIFVPVDLSAARHSLAHNTDPSLTGDARLKAAVETAMHCVIPWRVVLHVHSVNSIAWAVRSDAPDQIGARLEGLRWKWIPYVASGLALARRIEQAVLSDPSTRAFVLGNHGIVTAGPDCASAYETLLEIDRRLALPSRFHADRDWPDPLRAANWLLSDPEARRIIANGYLYPCHALFLGKLGNFGLFDEPAVKQIDCFSPEIAATLNGLAEVVGRIPDSAPLRFLTPYELSDLFAANVYQTDLRHCATGAATPQYPERTAALLRRDCDQAAAAARERGKADSSSHRS